MDVGSKIGNSYPLSANHTYIESKNNETMKFLTLDYIQKHSRIDGSCEAEILNLYGEAAEETVLNYLGMSLDELKAAHGGTVPKPVVQAALLLVDTSYQYRSPITPGNVSLVPYTFDILLKPYVKL